MFSWQQLQVRRDSTLICSLVPPGGVSWDWAIAWGGLQKPAIWDVMKMSGLPWAEARTQAAHTLLSAAWQYLFFLDCDVLAPPDTISRLMAHRLPIVSALYHQRYPTWLGIEGAYLPCMFNERRLPDGKVEKQVITEFQYGQLVEAQFVPAGCTLVHRSVFEALLQKGVRMFYQWTLTADNPVGFSEDFYFSNTCRDLLGIRSYVDTGVQAGHESTAVIGVKGMRPRI